jgi:hypothetical protein
MNRAHDGWQPVDLVISVAGPRDLLAAVPYLLGYRPTDSAVVLAMGGEAILATICADLPGPDADPAQAARAAEPLVTEALRLRADGVILAMVGPAERSLPLLDGLLDAYGSCGIAVHEALRLSDGWFWSYGCDEPVCCPPEGQRFDPGASAVPAEATLAGRVVLPDRATYEAQVEPVGGPSAAAVEAASERAADRLARLMERPPDARAARRALRAAGRAALDIGVRRHRDGQGLGDDDVAWLSVLLVADDVRELALRQILRRGDLIGAHRALWLDVLRRAAPDFVAGPACLFAATAHFYGERTLVRLALERVLDTDPDHPMARSFYAALVLGQSSTVDHDGCRHGDGPPVSPRPPGSRPRRRSSSRRAGSRPA